MRRRSSEGVTHVQIFLFRFLRDQSAATAIEYALVAAGIALAIVTIVKQLGNSVAAKYEAVSTSLK